MAPLDIFGSSLRTDEREIRLLSLHPGEWDAPIHCTREIVTLADSPSYHALSYVWGDPEIRQDISVHDRIVSVTQNLGIVLRYLRFENRSRRLWIDALCIDQNNRQERNTQVRMMGDIYAAANVVLIWIGEADQWTNQAFDAMDAIDQGDMNHPGNTEIFTFCIKAIENRPWFSRVWIMQELSLASQDPIVLCGGRLTTWSAFLSAWTIVSQALMQQLGMGGREMRIADGPVIAGRAEYSEDVRMMTKIDALGDLRRGVRGSGGETLTRVLYLATTQQATEPRDMVYGLLQMLSEATRAKITVDYEKPISSVFADAMSLVFDEGSGPRFLSKMRNHGGHSSIPDLPTWALDLTDQAIDKAKDAGGFIFHPPEPMSASGIESGAKNGRMSQDTKTLEVQSLPVDIVKDVIIFGNDMDYCIAQLTEVEYLAARALKQAPPDDALQPFYRKCRESEPLWKLLVLGKKSKSRYDIVPESYQRMYEALLKSKKTGSLMKKIKTMFKGSNDEYRACLEARILRRTFFTTERGLVGIGMPSVRPKDRVTIWFGSPVPFIVRPCSSPREDFCTFVGNAYVGGIMGGELVNGLYHRNLLGSETLFVV